MNFDGSEWGPDSAREVSGYIRCKLKFQNCSYVILWQGIYPRKKFTASNSYLCWVMVEVDGICHVKFIHIFIPFAVRVTSDWSDWLLQMRFPVIELFACLKFWAMEGRFEQDGLDLMTGNKRGQALVTMNVFVNFRFTPKDSGAEIEGRHLSPSRCPSRSWEFPVGPSTVGLLLRRQSD